MLGAQAVEREAHSHARERCRGGVREPRGTAMEFSQRLRGVTRLFVCWRCCTHHTTRALATTTTTHRDTNTLRVSTCCTTASAV